MYYSALDFRNIQPIPVPVTPQPLPHPILLVSKNRKCATCYFLTIGVGQVHVLVSYLSPAILNNYPNNLSS